MCVLIYIYIYIWLSAHDVYVPRNLLNDRDSIIYISIHKVEEVELNINCFYHMPYLCKWL